MATSDREQEIVRANMTIRGRRPNGFLGLSLNDGAILFLVILMDKTLSVG